MSHQSIVKSSALIVAAALSMTATAGPDKNVTGTTVNNNSTTSQTTAVDIEFGSPAAGHAIFVRAVKSLQDDTTPKSLQISEGQWNRVENIFNQYRFATNAFYQTNQQEITNLRRVIATQNAKAKKTIKVARSNEAVEAQKREIVIKEAKTQLEAIMSEMPQPHQFHGQVWSVLNEKQQAFVVKQLQDLAESHVVNEQVRKADPNTAVNWDQLETALSSMDSAQQQFVMKRMAQIFRHENPSTMQTWKEFRKQVNAKFLNTGETTEIADVYENDM